MNEIKCWRIDAKRVLFADLITWCRKHHQVDRLLLGIKMSRPDRPRARRPVASPKQLENAFKYFSPHVLSVQSVDGWPCTRFFGGALPLLEIELNDEVVKTCAEIGPTLALWTYWNDSNPLPEDPCLFRAGAPYPNLVTVAHERDALLLTDKPVNIHGVEFDPTVNPEDLYFDGALFCKNPRPCRSPFMRKFIK